MTGAPNGGLVDLEKAEGITKGAREGLAVGALRTNFCGGGVAGGGEVGGWGMARCAGRLKGRADQRRAVLKTTAGEGKGGDEGHWGLAVDGGLQAGRGEDAGSRGSAVDG